ncbi:ABC transporter substrate-binding protein [Glaciimonas sp. GNP009]
MKFILKGALVKGSFALLSCVALSNAATAAEEILVGTELPLTGPNARAGKSELEGIMAAADQFNAKNGKFKIKIISIDNETQPAKAVAAVEKLASQQVVALTSGYGSNLVGPASVAAEKAGLVYITSGGTDEGLTGRGLKNFFRINNTPGYEKAMAGLFGVLNVKSVSLISSTKEAPTDLAKKMQARLTTAGVKVVMHPFDPAITDFKPIINKVKLQDKSEAIAMIGYENDYVGILRAAKVLKPDVKAMVGIWSLATVKMAQDFPDLMPNVFGMALLPYPTAFKTPEGVAFGTAYKRLFNAEPDYLGQFGYVQSQLLFDAIARAADKGTMKTGGIAEELRKSDRETLIGRVRFNDKGDNVAFLPSMGQHNNGKIVVVWPKEMATGPMVFPGVPW